MKNGGRNGMKNGGSNGINNGVSNGMKNGGRNGMKNGGRNGMKNGGRNSMKNGGRNGIKNGGRKCIRNGVLKRRVGLALSDTFSYPNGGQKNGEKIKPQNGEKFWYKIFVPAFSFLRVLCFGLQG